MLTRSVAGARDAAQASNKQQVQQAQQGQNNGNRGDFLFIPALIALAAASEQHKPAPPPASTTSPASETAYTPASIPPTTSAKTTTTTVVTRTPIPTPAPALQPQQQQQPVSSGKPADPAGTVLDLDTGSKFVTSGQQQQQPAAVPAKDPAVTISPGKPGDPPGTVVILVPGSKAPAAPSMGPGPRPAQPGSSSSNGSSVPAGPDATLVETNSSSSGSSLTIIEVVTTAPPANSSTPGSGSSSGGGSGSIVVPIMPPSGAQAQPGLTPDGYPVVDKDDENGEEQPGGDNGSNDEDGKTGQQGADEPVVTEVTTPGEGQQATQQQLSPAAPAATKAPTSTPAASTPAPAPANPPPAAAGNQPPAETAGGPPLAPAVSASSSGAAVPAPPSFVFEQKGAKSMILVGCALPFEGSQRIVGEAVFQALKMAIIDKAPKVMPDVNVNLTCINSKCIDIPTFNAVYELAQDKAVAVIGEVCSGASVAAAGVSNAKKLPIISPSSTSPSLSQPDFFFRVIPSDTHQGMAVADLMINSGHKNVGLVYEDSPYGYGLGYSFIAAFTAHGGNVPVVYMFKKGQGNATEAVRQLAEGKQSDKFSLDGVFVSTNNITFIADLLVAAKAGDLGLKLYGGDSSANPELVDLIGGRPSVISNFTVVAPYPGNAAFLRAFSDFITKNKADPLAASSVYAARGYDAMTALLQAYQAARSPKDGPAIIAALQQQKFTGVSGPIEFDKNGDLLATNTTYVYGLHTQAGGIKVQDFINTTNDKIRVAP